MAERVNAFKSKYTGEQMEELFNKLANSVTDIPSAGENQYYSTELPITNTNTNGGWFRSQTVETSFGFLSYTGLSNIEDSGCTNILSLLSTNSLGIELCGEPTTLIYTFKKPVTLLRHRCNVYQGTIYYWINDEWVKQCSVYGTVQLTNQQTVEKVKIEFPYASNGILKYSIFDFMSDEYIISGPAIITEE